MSANKKRPYPKKQLEFWKDYSNDDEPHDPRGTRSYLQRYVHHDEPEWIDGHRPHPNIILHAKHTHERPNPHLAAGSGGDGAGSATGGGAAAGGTPAGAAAAGAAAVSSDDDDDDDGGEVFAESEL